MAWDKTKPVTDGPLESAPIRANWEALDTLVVAPVTTLVAESLLKVGAGDVIAGIPPTTNGHVLTLVGGAPDWAAASFSNPMSGVGDLIRGGTAGAPTRLAPTTNGFVLTLAAGVPTWMAGFVNPMSAVGDLVVGTTAGAPQRLPAVAIGSVFASAGAGVTPVWSENLRLGIGTIGTSGARVIALGGSTAPSTSPVDAVQMWAADVLGKAGYHGFHLRDEGGARYVIGMDGTDYPVIRALAPAGGGVEVSCGAGWCGVGTAPGVTGVTSLWSSGGGWSLDTDGHFRPDVNAVKDLGTSALRVRNVYAGQYVTGIANGQMVWSTSGTLYGNANLTTDGSSLTVGGNISAVFGVSAASLYISGASTLTGTISCNAITCTTINTQNNNIAAGSGYVSVGTLDSAGGVIARTSLYVQDLASAGHVILGQGTGWLTQTGNLVYTVVGSESRLSVLNGTDATVTLQAGGGHYIQFFSAGTSTQFGAAGAGGAGIHNANLNRNLIMWNNAGHLNLVHNAEAQKFVTSLAPNSAGAGYRYLVIAN